MNIKTGDIINLNYFGDGYSDFMFFYVMGIDQNRYFLKDVNLGGEKNGKKHFVLRDSDSRVSYYRKEDMERMKPKLEKSNVKFKQIKYLTEDGWTAWTNITVYGDDEKEMKELIEYKGYKVLETKEREI